MSQKCHTVWSFAGSHPVGESAFAQASPAGRATATAAFLGEQAPGAARAQDEDDAAEGCPARVARPAAFRLGRLLRQQGCNGLPELVRETGLGRPAVSFQPISPVASALRDHGALSGTGSELTEQTSLSLFNIPKRSCVGSQRCTCSAGSQLSRPRLVL